MTIQELNALPYLTANIERIMNYLEADNMSPDWFIPCGEAEPDPMREGMQQELSELMAEYRRLMAYISRITSVRMKRIFEMRFVDRRSMREIAVKYGVTSGTLKKQIYDYVRFNPEGFCSCRELADRLGLNYETVRKWCVKGKIPGAEKRGRRKWYIPLDAELPQSRRYRKNKSS